MQKYHIANPTSSATGAKEPMAMPAIAPAESSLGGVEVVLLFVGSVGSADPVGMAAVLVEAFMVGCVELSMIEKLQCVKVLFQYDC